MQFQCRTRQMVGCNEAFLRNLSLSISGFNAARGRWSVATLCQLSYRSTDYVVSMPHAASGRLQHQNLYQKPPYFTFQCRTRQVVGCNVNIIIGTAAAIVVSMPHAASGRLQLNLKKYYQTKKNKFQCRTRQVVGCNYIGNSA